MATQLITKDFAETTSYVYNVQKIVAGILDNSAKVFLTIEPENTVSIENVSEIDLKNVKTTDWKKSSMSPDKVSYVDAEFNSPVKCTITKQFDVEGKPQNVSVNCQLEKTMLETDSAKTLRQIKF
jgi:hypothetical protein